MKTLDGLKNAGVNLRDHIDDTLNSFPLDDYIGKVESNDYLSKLPGIKDLISALKKGLSFLKGLVKKILDFIDWILAILDMIIDTIDKFVDMVLNFLSSLLGAFGLSLYDITGIMNLLNALCIDVEDTKKANWGKLDTIILAILIAGLSCSGHSKDIYPHIATALQHSETITDINEHIADLQNDLDNSNDNLERTQLEKDIKDYKDILLTKASTNTTTSDIVNEINNTLADIKSLEDEIKAFKTKGNDLPLDDIIDDLNSAREALNDDYERLEALILDGDDTDLKNALKNLQDARDALDAFIKKGSPEIDKINYKLIELEKELARELNEANLKLAQIAIITTKAIADNPNNNVDQLMDFVISISETTVPIYLRKMEHDIVPLTLETLDRKSVKVQPKPSITRGDGIDDIKFTLSKTYSKPKRYDPIDLSKLGFEFVDIVDNFEQMSYRRTGLKNGVCDIPPSDSIPTLYFRQDKYVKMGRLIDTLKNIDNKVYKDITYLMRYRSLYIRSYYRQFLVINRLPIVISTNTALLTDEQKLAL